MTNGVVLGYNNATMAKITKRYCEGRKSPYQLFWIEDGIRHSRFFETEEARDDFLRLNGHLDKRSFEALLLIDENTISDLSYKGTSDAFWKFLLNHLEIGSCKI